MSAKKVPVAGVILRDDAGKYLLVQEKQSDAYGLWNLPAGWQDKGETLQQTAIREAREEVGLNVELIDDEPLVVMLNDSKGSLRFQEDEVLNAKWLDVKEVEHLAADGKLRNRWTLESVKKADESSWD